MQVKVFVSIFLCITSVTIVSGRGSSGGRSSSGSSSSRTSSNRGSLHSSSSGTHRSSTSSNSNSSPGWFGWSGRNVSPPKPSSPKAPTTAFRNKASYPVRANVGFSAYGNNYQSNFHHSHFQPVSHPYQSHFQPQTCELIPNTH